MRPHDPSLCDHLVVELVGGYVRSARLPLDEAICVPAALESFPETEGVTMVGPLMPARRPAVTSVLSYLGKPGQWSKLRRF